MDALLFVPATALLIALLVASGFALVGSGPGAARGRAQRWHGGAAALGVALLCAVWPGALFAWLGEIDTSEFIASALLGLAIADGPFAPWAVHAGLPVAGGVALVAWTAYGLLVWRSDLGLVHPLFHALVAAAWSCAGFAGLMLYALTVG